MAPQAESFNARSGPGSECFKVWTLVITIICGYDYIFSVTKKATGPKVSDQAWFVRILYLTTLFEMLECPNESNNSNKRPKSFGSSTNDNIAAICYRCQEAGHYSSGQYSAFGTASITSLIFLA